MLQISHLIALAPIFHLGHIEGPYKLLIPFKSILGKIFEDISNGSFLPWNNVSMLIKYLAKAVDMLV